jgi:hypothetical protein
MSDPLNRFIAEQRILMTPLHRMEHGKYHHTGCDQLIPAIFCLIHPSAYSFRYIHHHLVLGYTLNHVSEYRDQMANYCRNYCRHLVKSSKLGRREIHNLLLLQSISRRRFWIQFSIVNPLLWTSTNGSGCLLEALHSLFGAWCTSDRNKVHEAWGIIYASCLKREGSTPGATTPTDMAIPSLR